MDHVFPTTTTASAAVLHKRAAARLVAVAATASFLCLLGSAPLVVAAAAGGDDVDVPQRQQLPNNGDGFFFRSFSFQSSPEVGYRLSTNVVPGEFCGDPSSSTTSSLSFSGYFGVDGSKYDDDDGGKNYFYWFFEKRRKATRGGVEELEADDGKKVPFVIWLNGGPGCSSMMGLLQENGPCLVNDDGHSTRVNPHSWTEAAHARPVSRSAGIGGLFLRGDERRRRGNDRGGCVLLSAEFLQERGGGEVRGPAAVLDGGVLCGTLHTRHGPSNAKGQRRPTDERGGHQW